MPVASWVLFKARQLTEPIRAIQNHLIRASGLIGANYIKVNEKLGDKNFKFRLKIARNEAKETIYWLNWVSTHNEVGFEKTRLNLLKKAEELQRILSATSNKF